MMRQRDVERMLANLPGIKQVLLPWPKEADSPDTSAVSARALFGPPPETTAAERRRSLVDFLGRVTLFADLGRWQLRRLARIVHERDYRDGEYICEEGQPGAALFILRRGLVEIVRRGSQGKAVPLVTLEPPASFDEAAALETVAMRLFSARACGPVSVLALGKADLDALSANFPLAANKVLMRLAGIMATRLHMLLETQYLKESGEHPEAAP
jgi:CRP-like cAMP-binding protein